MMRYEVKIKAKLRHDASEESLIQRLKDMNFMDDFLYDTLAEIIKAVLMGYHPETEYKISKDGYITSIFEQSDTYHKSLKHFFEDIRPFLDNYSNMEYTVWFPNGVKMFHKIP